jgi:hypothetical protein
MLRKEKRKSRFKFIHTNSGQFRGKMIPKKKNASQMDWSRILKPLGCLCSGNPGFFLRAISFHSFDIIIIFGDNNITLI